MLCISVPMTVRVCRYITDLNMCVHCWYMCIYKGDESTESTHVLIMGFREYWKMSTSFRDNDTFLLSKSNRLGIGEDMS